MSRPSPKRARQKDRRAQRREEWAREYRRRRRQRLTAFLVSFVVLAVVVGAVGLFVVKPSKSKKTTAPSPSPSVAPAVRCDPTVPEAAKTKKPSYDAPEDQGLDPSTTYTWRLETSCGRIDIALDVARAPETTNSIVFLTRKSFYDGLFFHRNVADFVIQGGDPLGTGTGGSGYKVVEAPPKDLKYDVGVVAMAKGGQEASGTSGSQFFIMVGTSSPLPPDYALVGKVSAGMDIAQKIVRAAPGEPPTVKIYIKRATIVEG